MRICDVHQGICPHKRRKRVGRGSGSGHGKTAGRGFKGQRSRTNHGNLNPTYEGGQMPLFRRLPKRGFNNARFRKTFAVVNVEDLNHFEDGSVVDAETLRKAGLVRGVCDGVRVLGDGVLERKLVVKASGFSVVAAKKITDKGGQAEKIA
ncbi:MAG: 50S ribosomal protein L15 [Planctomycetota bacterium]